MNQRSREAGAISRNGRHFVTERQLYAVAQESVCIVYVCNSTFRIWRPRLRAKSVTAAQRMRVVGTDLTGRGICLTCSRQDEIDRYNQPNALSPCKSPGQSAEKRAAGRGISPLLLAFLETVRVGSPATGCKQGCNYKKTVPVNIRAGALLAKIALLSRQI